MGMDEVHNAYFNIINAMVIQLVKLLTNGVFSAFRGNIVEVVLESVH